MDGSDDLDLEHLRALLMVIISTGGRHFTDAQILWFGFDQSEKEAPPSTPLNCRMPPIRKAEKPMKTMERINDLKGRLPYGVWSCGDGREVLFNRWYKPILQRKGGVVSDADPEERMPRDGQKWFYTDANPPWHSKKTRTLCESILAEWSA
jgi:hypothetical protein